MNSQEKQLFCRLDGLTVTAREQQREKIMTELGLLQTESIPVFEEATQTTAQTLKVPICVLGLMQAEQERFKSAIGLSKLGLMNELATSRQISRSESFSTHVVDSQQALIIDDTLSHPAFANSALVYQYGIRAYLGAPLVTSTKCCVGTLAVIDTTPRNFTEWDVEFLQTMARWSMSEYERSQLAIKLSLAEMPTTIPESIPVTPSLASQLRVDLLNYLTQELRTPLTSVMGMASVLNREIYGPLTNKQKEYLNIIHNSGQYLLSLMNEVVELAEYKESDQELNLTLVDVEMLCQQVINTLEQAAQRRDQQIRSTVEPGRRIWLIDKDKIRQLLYHLIFSVIQTSTAGSVIRLHISRRETSLNLSIWVSHPWLGDGLLCTGVSAEPALVGVASHSNQDDFIEDFDPEIELEGFWEEPSVKAIAKDDPTSDSRKHLGLLLSQHLVELHGGQFLIQSSAESGSRYVISLPYLTEPTKE